MADSTRRRVDVDALADAVLADRRADLARAITLVESKRPDHRAAAQELLLKLTPHAGNSFRVGITGVPGVGKSTTIEALGMHLVELGHKVAVLAVDPSSTRTRGSILGDKTRIDWLSAIRSIPVARGSQRVPFLNNGVLMGVHLRVLRLTDATVGSSKVASICRPDRAWHRLATLFAGGSRNVCFALRVCCVDAGAGSSRAT